MVLSFVLLYGALILQEPYQAPPSPQDLRRVTRYHPFMFQGSEVPFKLRQEFVPADQVPDDAVLSTVAREEDVIIEVCRSSRSGAAGQWLWPEHDLEVRRRQCRVYGTPREQQP